MELNREDIKEKVIKEIKEKYTGNLRCTNEYLEILESKDFDDFYTILEKTIVKCFKDNDIILDNDVLFEFIYRISHDIYVYSVDKGSIDAFKSNIKQHIEGDKHSYYSVMHIMEYNLIKYNPLAYKRSNNQMWIFAKSKKTLNKIINELNIENYEFKITSNKELGSCYTIELCNILPHILDEYSSYLETFYLENNY